MAFEVTKIYKEHFPALRFIGKRYTNDDRGPDGFGRQWNEWMSGKLFGKMENEVGIKPFNGDTIGLMTMRGDMTGFTYWIGLFSLLPPMFRSATISLIYRRVTSA